MYQIKLNTTEPCGVIAITSVLSIYISINHPQNLNICTPTGTDTSENTLKQEPQRDLEICM